MGTRGDKSSHLRRLKLENPGDISPSAFAAAVKKLMQLEELHLIRVAPLDAEDVETIGISCPLLNSFTYKEKWGNEYGRNVIALAIAKNMPNLHHLRLVGYVMKNEGLEEILDGCPCLESLDLLYCYGLHLTGALMERCSKQIKFSRLPIYLFDDDSEPSDEYGYDYEYDYDD